MVSDILFEAVTLIEEYKEEMQNIYVKNPVISKKLEHLLVEMNRVRIFLDMYNPNNNPKNAELIWVEICSNNPDTE